MVKGEPVMGNYNRQRQQSLGSNVLALDNKEKAAAVCLINFLWQVIVADHDPKTRDEKKKLM